MRKGLRILTMGSKIDWQNGSQVDIENLIKLCIFSAHTWVGDTIIAIVVKINMSGQCKGISKQQKIKLQYLKIYMMIRDLITFNV